MSLVALLLLFVASTLAEAVKEENQLHISTTRHWVNASICCPIGWSLVKLNMGFFRSDVYECRNVFHNDDNSEYIGNIENKTEIFERTAPVYGYRIQAPAVDDGGNYSGEVPQCKRQTFVFLTGDKELELPANTCLTSVDRRLAAIYCPPARGETLQTLSVVHKCCPLRYVYDADNQKCVQRAGVQTFQRYGYLLQQWSIFVDGTVQCASDMVLVEYNLSGKEVKFIDGKVAIAVRSEWKKFKQSEYCMEAIEGANAWNDLAEQRYLVRTCEPRRVCQGIACIRRCCSDGEFFTKANKTSYCKRDEADIGFHSFESLQISGNFTKPAGKFTQLIAIS
ncbi:unnamed protein product [Ceratitis capitata]|uniref:(Mediterranean fruit fly) hypothetical protein n=1 Tax=Ceratitis capitata TaxID=7213 RepID=A0A811UHJ5_CERCA|nr:unnamed protein product [Ceratitis capitata]